MATIKSCTDLKQSKKLAEILPLESADMYYWCADYYPKEDWIIEVGAPDGNYECICAWSLIALLNVLPSASLDSSDDHHYRLYCMERFTEWYDNPVDACVEMIIKLKELNLL